MYGKMTRDIMKLHNSIVNEMFKISTFLILFSFF